MKRNDLNRLLWLRMKRKEKALEKVAVRQAALSRAEHNLKEARDAIRSHIETSRAQEASHLSGVLGQKLNYAEINELRSIMTIIAERLDELRSWEKQADKERETAQADLKAAAAVFREHHRSAEKLNYVLVEQRRKHGRKLLALSEASEDDVQSRRKGTARAGD